MVYPSRFGRVFAVAALGLFSMCVSAQAQLSFSTPQKVSTNVADYAMSPAMAVDASGNIYVAWEDDTNTNSNILFSWSSDGGKTFSTPKNLSLSSGYSFNARIAVDSQGGIDVVWIDPTLGSQDILFGRSTDGGKTFSKVNLSNPSKLSQNVPDCENPQIAVDASGKISVVWDCYDITLGVFFTHSTDGATFSTPVNLTANTTGSLAPQIALGADGSINVVWEDDFNAQGDIFFARSTDGGASFYANPPNPTNISHNAGNSSDAQIVLDGSGNINVVWVDDTPGNFVVMFSRLAANGTTFSSPQNLSNTGNSSAVQMLADASGNIHVVWQENSPAVFNADIFYASLMNGASAFSVPQNVSNNGGNSINPSISADSSGNVNVGWTDSTPGKAAAFFAQLVKAGKTFSAPQNLSNDSGTSSGVQIGTDNSGNLDVVWSDDASGTNQVLFSRFAAPQLDPPPPPKVNHPPVAVASGSQTVECAGHGGTLVTLDGSASYDPDGGTLSFAWTDELNNPLGATAIVHVTATLGAHTFTLTVTDTTGLTATASTQVTVRDTVPPTLSVSLSPTYLWPANHKLVKVTASVAASDVCDASPSVQLVSITSSDPLDADDVQVATGGLSFMLSAERSNPQTPRVYTVTYMAKDASGNKTQASARVVVSDPSWRPVAAAAKQRIRKKQDRDRD